MEINKLVWKIGGEAGYGIMSIGLMFSKVCTRAGLYVYDYAEYPSLIRGGHNTYDVRVEQEEIFSQIRLVDILVALNEETVRLHINELTSSGALIYDGDATPIDLSKLRKDIIYISVPLVKIAREIGKDPIMRNTVSLGASFALVGLDFDIVRGVIEDTFSGKDKEIIDTNVSTAKAGYDFVIAKNISFKNKLQKVKSPLRMVVSGNEAIGMGAIKAGMKFFCAYPMTPTSSILHFLAAYDRDYSYVVKQAEDEISAINMAIGAGFAGVRAMTATSGGGYCLMVEGVGLATMSETPVVIIEGMRGGPSTGLPTWTDQSDLRFIIHSSHGDAPKIVLAAGDHEDCFYLTGDAFNYADRYQMPIVLITDKHLAEGHKSVERFDQNKIRVDRGFMISEKDAQVITDYKRYKFTENGISLRAIPGLSKNTLFLAGSDEHDEYGSFDEDADNRRKMMEKRSRKFDLANAEIKNKTRLYGSEKALISIISWGSTKAMIREAMKWLSKEEIEINFMQVICLNPFPSREIKDLLLKSKRVLIIETSKSGDLLSLIKENTLMDIKDRMLKYDGRPFYPEEIYDKIKEMMKNS